MQKIFIERLASFVPTEARPKPDVSFVPMLTRRRLSYISRMVVLVSDQVSRDNEGNKLTPCKVTFASQFGEISQQLKISQTLIDSRNEHRRLFRRILRERRLYHRPHGLHRRPRKRMRRHAHVHFCRRAHPRDLCSRRRRPLPERRLRHCTPPHDRRIQGRPDI